MTNNMCMENAPFFPQHNDICQQEEEEEEEEEEEKVNKVNAKFQGELYFGPYVLDRFGQQKEDVSLAALNVLYYDMAIGF